MLNVVLTLAKQLANGRGIRDDTLEEHYHSARITGYGRGDHSQYAKAFHPNLGLITDKKNAIILHLDSDADKQKFRQDVTEAPLQILQAVGPGKGLDIYYKNVSVSGSLTPDECDEELVDAILRLGIPFFFIPHTSSTPITIPNTSALSIFSTFVKLEAPMPENTPTLMPYESWSSGYQDHIWKRLMHLPVTYRLPVLEITHKISRVCESITVITSKFENVDTTVMTQIAAELYIHTLRGVAISLTYLAWHGLGFDAGIPLVNLRKLLRQLRGKETMTLRDVQRLARFENAEVRDDVMGRLVAEGLITLEGKYVTTVTHKKFVEGLYSREEFPMAVLVDVES
jgi:hypothetical protein